MLQEVPHKYHIKIVYRENFSMTCEILLNIDYVLNIVNKRSFLGQSWHPNNLDLKQKKIAIQRARNMKYHAESEIKHDIDIKFI